MKQTLFISIRLLIIMTVITGFLYPMFITAISRAFFYEKAEGSLVKRDGIIVGSKLIGQQFDSPSYFHSRPSAVNYQTLPSGASNYSRTEKRLKNLVELRKDAFLKENMLNDTTVIPIEMLFSSASGIDPHISPRAALLQVERIAMARKFNEEQKQKLTLVISKIKENPQYSLLGEERINIFLLNLELDKIE